MKADAEGAHDRVVDEPTFPEGDDPRSLSKEVRPPPWRARLIGEAYHGISFKMNADRRSQREHHLALRHAKRQLTSSGEPGIPNQRVGKYPRGNSPAHARLPPTLIARTTICELRGGATGARCPQFRRPSPVPLMLEFALGEGAILAAARPFAPIVLPLSSAGLLGKPPPIAGPVPNGFVRPRCGVRPPALPELAVIPCGLPVPRAERSPGDPRPGPLTAAPLGS